METTVTIVLKGNGYWQIYGEDNREITDSNNCQSMKIADLVREALKSKATSYNRAAERI